MYTIFKIIVLICLANCHCNPIDDDSLIFPEDSDTTTGRTALKRATDTTALNFSVPDIKISEFPQFVMQKMPNMPQFPNISTALNMTFPVLENNGTRKDAVTEKGLTGEIEDR